MRRVSKRLYLLLASIGVVQGEIRRVDEQGDKETVHVLNEHLAIVKRQLMVAAGNIPGDALGKGFKTFLEEEKEKLEEGKEKREKEKSAQ